MVTPLKRVMVCPPSSAGWTQARQAARWRELNYLRAPDAATAQAHHDALRRELEGVGAEVLTLTPGDALSLDAVYCHDTSLVTDFGAIPLRPGKACRADEQQHHADFYRAARVPILGELQSPGTAEAGDMVWLDARTLLVGRGYRTNAAGIEQLRALLRPHSVEVLAAPLPHGTGPECCLHLMSLMSLLDERTALVDLSMLAVETVELLRVRGFRFVEIDPAERASLACNVLALGESRLLALEENARTNTRLRSAGFNVRTFPGSAIAINGGGGPTCLTRPILRV